MSETTHHYAAIDLGATSGRVIHCVASPSGLRMREAHRFANEPLRWPTGLHWDIGGLYRNAVHGLRQIDADVTSIGIDTWGVDYGLIGHDGRLLGLPFHYRDERTRDITVLPDAAAVYRRTGVLSQSINTRMQIAAEDPHGALASARHLLLMPDLMAYLLTGQLGAERTIASTSQLLGTDGEWAVELLQPSARPGLLPALRAAGSVIGPLTASAAAETGVAGHAVLTAVASHDTASALVAVPNRDVPFAYVSCGTWALVGLELEHPELGDASRRAGFTNELGFDGTVRFQRNGTGLWMLSECAREWAATDSAFDLTQILDAAGAQPAFRSIVDPLSPQFAVPGGMVTKIRAACLRTDEPDPDSPARIARCILDSLALSWAATIRDAEAITGVHPRTVHIVGGGSRNAGLCQSLADCTGLPVVAGPVEATALGNLLVQASADLGISGLVGLRELAARSAEVTHYLPRLVAGLDAALGRSARVASATSGML